MSTEITYNEQADKAMEFLTKGAFLSTAADGQVNTMTISWGSIGFAWHRPIFMALVRPSRHSYGLLEKSQEFTVSIPFTDMKEALALCGSKSGRDMDKFAAAGLTAVPARQVTAPVVGGCGIYYECKVVLAQDIAPEKLAEICKSAHYANGDYHRLYFAEIVACYNG